MDGVNFQCHCSSMQTELEIVTQICSANLSEHRNFVLPLLNFDLTF